MAEIKRKKKSFFGRVFGFLGILILLLIIAAVLCFFILIVGMSKKNVSIDDIYACVNSRPADLEEHLSFSPDGTMTVTLDKTDLWCFLDEELGENWQNDLKSAAERYGCTYTGCGLTLTDRETAVNFEFYRSFIRIVFSVICDVDLADGEITVTPQQLKLLEIPIPLKPIIKLVTGEEEFVWSYRPKLSLMKSMESVASAENALVISGPLDPELFAMTHADPEELKVLGFSRNSAVNTAKAILQYADSEEAFEQSILKEYSGTTDVLADMIVRSMAMNYANISVAAGKNNGLITRWFPGFPTDDGKAVRNEIDGEYERVCEHLGRLAEKISSEYVQKNFTIKKGALLYNKAPYNAKEFLGISYDLLIQSFNVEGLQLCLCSNSGLSYEYYPTLKEITDSADSLPEGTVLTDVYFPGALLSGSDDREYLLLCKGGSAYNLIPLSEEAFEQALETSVPMLDLAAID